MVSHKHQIDNGSTLNVYPFRAALKIGLNMYSEDRLQDCPIRYNYRIHVVYITEHYNILLSMALTHRGCFLHLAL